MDLIRENLIYTSFRNCTLCPFTQSIKTMVLYFQYFAPHVDCSKIFGVAITNPIIRCLHKIKLKNGKTEKTEKSYPSHLSLEDLQLTPNNFINLS